jgi:hypothetical protein
MADLAATVAFGLLFGGQFLGAILCYREDQRFTQTNSSSSQRNSGRDAQWDRQAGLTLNSC